MFSAAAAHSPHQLHQTSDNTRSACQLQREYLDRDRSLLIAGFMDIVLRQVQRLLTRDCTVCSTAVAFVLSERSVTAQSTRVIINRCQARSVKVTPKATILRLEFPACITDGNIAAAALRLKYVFRNYFDEHACETEKLGMDVVGHVIIVAVEAPGSDVRRFGFCQRPCLEL